MPTIENKTATQSVSRVYDAITFRRHDVWYADVTRRNGDVISYKILGDDPWNFDIDNGLPVQIRLVGKSSCHVLKRLQNNKRYVTINTQKGKQTE